MSRRSPSLTSGGGGGGGGGGSLPSCLGLRYCLHIDQQSVALLPSLQHQNYIITDCVSYSVQQPGVTFANFFHISLLPGTYFTQPLSLFFFLFSFSWSRPTFLLSICCPPQSQLHLSWTLSNPPPPSKYPLCLSVFIFTLPPVGQTVLLLKQASNSKSHRTRFTGSRLQSQKHRF